MKKHRALWVILIVVVVLAAAAAGGWYWLSSEAAQAEQAHSAIYAQFAAMTAAVDRVTLTVTEDGSPVGAYDLQTLGLRDGLMNKVAAQFSEADRMTDEQFAALGIREKLNWAKRGYSAPYFCAVSMEKFNAAAVLADLRSMKRTAAADAYATLESGVYTVHAEVPGTELNEQAVLDGLRAAASSLGVTADSPLNTEFELTSVDCYKQPVVTTETLHDTPDSLFRTALAALEVRVSFNAESAQYLPHGEEVLTSHDLASIVDMGSDGTVTVDEKALSDRVAQWTEQYSKRDTPFLFDSWVKGLTEIDFITCDYQIDAQSVTEQLRAQLLTMQSGTVSVEAVCYDKDGKPFSLGDSYIEVDFDNQQMTFIKNGRLVVNTDIVTGAINGHQTPTGLYDTHGKEHDIWLQGTDYLVFVKYWVGVIGNLIGLHDSSWRENFGGSIYVYGGSHGCINTPDEAMATIWNLAEDGTPVLMYGANEWFDPANGNPYATRNPVRGTTSKISVPNGTRVLEPGSSRIEIQPDDVVPFELPKESGQDEASPSNTEATAKPVS